MSNSLKLPEYIESDFKNNKIPVSDERINKWLYGLINDSYVDSVSCFSDDITKFDKDTITNKLSKLVLIAQKIEFNFKDELEKLCGDVVLSLFNNINNVKLECYLVNSCANNNFNIKPNILNQTRYNSLKDITDEKTIILKRKFGNLFTIGASEHIAYKLLEEISEDLAQYNENLPLLYEKIMRINSYLNFINNTEITDKNNLQGAYVNVNFNNSQNNEEPEINIISKGIIFPYLLVETVKGFIEAISSKYISNTEANLIEQTDILTDEPWNYRLGETFFKRFISNNSSDMSFIPEYLEKIFSLKLNKFIGLMFNAVVNTVEFEEKNNSLINKINHNIQYKNFEINLDKKRNEKEILMDEYLGIEELQ